MESPRRVEEETRAMTDTWGNGGVNGGQLDILSGAEGYVLKDRRRRAGPRRPAKPDNSPTPLGF